MNVQLPDIPRKVLLVDDEENILRSITRLLLEDDDLEVVTATCGTEGLELLKAHPDVGLILSDQRMPGMSGAEFLQQAREVAPEAVRMVLTGYADMAATVDAINKGGASRYITKPWDDEMLRHAVLEGLEQYLLVQRNRQLSALVERQNQELSAWNQNLKGRVLEQTSTIRQQNEKLSERHRQIERAFRQTLVAFSRLIEQHSSRLQEHTTQVTELATELAQALGLDPGEVETIRTAALLHDIGVIGIAPEILEKHPGLLSAEETRIFLQHAVRGQAAVDEVEELREAGVLIRHHHERYDGTGFPDRLAGSNIPLGARILSCADFIDRQIDKQRGEAAVNFVLERARRELGHQLDPGLFLLLEPLVRARYLPGRSAQAEAAERELPPGELEPGMFLTRNLVSGSGALLLAKGTCMDERKIGSVRHLYHSDPPPCGVFVSFRPEDAAPSPAPPEDPLELELELRPRDLVEGMCTTRNLYSGTGLLLLTAGTPLDAKKIVSVKRYYQIDPPPGGVFVTRPES
ncbi:two-component system response regulator [Geomonas limicola]|uniref:Two-component system response regulator n=1 Tax=Geomonas limicola TaxID=2740186 RepID=A0A6V8NDU6_9BACT|nr:HD domain-containing phosphohydrolase [Geomonas limicola]GFO69994.1 two-component system response regulator [Geomonas limicola]